MVLTVGETAALLKVSTRTVQRWLATGVLYNVAPSGRHIRIARSQLDKLLEVEPSPDPSPLLREVLDEVREMRRELQALREALAAGSRASLDRLK